MNPLPSWEFHEFETAMSKRWRKIEINVPKDNQAETLICDLYLNIYGHPVWILKVQFLPLL